MKDKHIYIYLEIYEHLKDMILSDVLNENDKLPSKRKLATHFKVSPITIQKAYQELIDEGYVYTVEKKGYFVAKKISLFINEKQPKELRFKEATKKSYKFDFNTSYVDTAYFPHQKWVKLSREVLSEHKETMLNEVNPLGLGELRTEIAKHLDLYRGMKVQKEQIIIGSSSTQLLNLLVEILGRDKVYALEDPSYPKIYYLFKTLDMKVHLIPLDDSGLRVDVLEKTDTNVLHIAPSHQYPTGIMMPIQRRIELLNWAYDKDNRYIIEDDYDSEFKYQGRPISALQGLDKGEKVIYMNTFSKSLAPSFRVAYLVLPIHLMKQYEKVMHFHSCTVPNFEQYILYKFMSEQHFSRHLHKMMKIYREKLELMLDIVKPYKKIEMKFYESGLHFMLVFDSLYKEHELIEILEKEDISVSGMTNFRQVKNKNDNRIELVIGYSGLSFEDIEIGYKRLLDILSAYVLR